MNQEEKTLRSNIRDLIRFVKQKKKSGRVGARLSGVHPGGALAQEGLLVGHDGADG